MKKNLICSSIVGFLTSWFLIFVIKNPFIEEFKGLASLGDKVWWLLLITPVLFFVGMLAAIFISRIISVFLQLAKFAEVGILNTAIDFGILNLLIWLTGITGGWAIAPLNAASFLCATTNSYFWNKFWTFKKKGGAAGGEFVQFLVISAIGIGINTGIVVAGTTLISPALGMSPAAWANIMKLLATFVSLVWNFLGYKFIVFKEIKQSQTPLN
jgi:putative flippase GtrA